MEADVETLEAQMAQAPADAPDVHPNVADLYQRRVESLIDALNRSEDRDRAAQNLRTVIDKIVLTPGAKRGEVQATLYGDFETVVAWAAERDVARREAGKSFYAEPLSVAHATRACITRDRQLLAAAI